MAFEERDQDSEIPFTLIVEDVRHRCRLTAIQAVANLHVDLKGILKDATLSPDTEWRYASTPKHYMLYQIRETKS